MPLAKTFLYLLIAWSWPGDLDLAIPSWRLVFECRQRRLPVRNASHPHRAFSLALFLPPLPSSAGDLDPAQTRGEDMLLAYMHHCFPCPSSVTVTVPDPHRRTTCNHMQHVTLFFLTLQCDLEANDPCKPKWMMHCFCRMQQNTKFSCTSKALVPCLHEKN